VSDVTHPCENSLAASPATQFRRPCLGHPSFGNSPLPAPARHKMRRVPEAAWVVLLLRLQTSAPFCRSITKFPPSNRYFVLNLCLQAWGCCVQRGPCWFQRAQEGAGLCGAVPDLWWTHQLQVSHTSWHCYCFHHPTGRVHPFSRASRVGLAPSNSQFESNRITVVGCQMVMAVWQPRQAWIPCTVERQRDSGAVCQIWHVVHAACLCDSLRCIIMLAGWCCAVARAAGAKQAQCAD
jgi:hypothetical protein